MHNYDKKLNIETLRQCECCLKMGNHRVQHHVYGRRYNEACIWVCVTCHAEIHANPAWAYKFGYLKHHNNSYITKMKKEKKCQHGKTYNKFPNGVLKVYCSYCNQEVGEMNFGKTKPKEEKTSKSPRMKMGYEGVNPHTKRAEELKRAYSSINFKIKAKNLDPESKKLLLEDLADIKKKMINLQNNIDEEQSN